MKKIVAIFLITALLQACALTPPAPPTFNMPKDSRVGIYVDTGSNPYHAHIGTTIFNNFQKQYPYNWDLEVFTYVQVDSQLKKAGFITINLKKAGFTFAEIKHLVTQHDKEWAHNPQTVDASTRLRDDFGLSAVVVIKESQVQADLECAGGPCSNRMIGGSGLYSRSMFGMTRYKAVAAITTKIFLLDPPAQLDRNGPLSSQWDDRAINLNDYAGAEDFDNFTKNELQPVRIAIEEYITRMAENIVTSLNPTQTNSK